MFQEIKPEELRGVHFLQSLFWAHIRTELGWNCKSIEITALPHKPTMLLLERRIVSSLPFSFIYAPYALEDVQPDAQTIYQLLYQVGRQLFPSAIFLRWDTPFGEQTYTAESLRMGGFRPAPAVQVPNTLVLDLQMPLEKIFASFKPKTRYNIKLAERKGVTIRSSNDIAQWYAVYQATQKRQGMGIHQDAYYTTVFNTWRAIEHAGTGQGSIQLYIAEHEGDILGGIIVVQYNKLATYLYGASADIKRNYMAAYLLQWHAICCAHQASMHYYDFFGVAPKNSNHHPLRGLYQFKSGFGGSPLERLGCWDVVLKPSGYMVLRALEIFRRSVRAGS